jgi:hypothetical protein
MLETGAVLRTWALERLPQDWLPTQLRTAQMQPGCPSVAASAAVEARRLGDHRLEYLQLEGLLSGNRGSVVRVAAGTYHSESETAEHWRITLDGDELAGPILLARSEPSSSRWILECQALA